LALIAFRPVLLVPGWKDRARVLAPLARFLSSSGWPDGSVRAIEFRDPFGSNIAHAEELAHAIAELRRHTGTTHVDVVAHSMGGLAFRYFLKEAGADHGIARTVFLATPHAGTLAAWLAFGGSRQELLPGSAFLNALGPLPPGVRAVCIHTPWDLRVLPRRSAVLDGVEAVRVDRVTHRGMLRNIRVHTVIRSALLAP
jgi:pimeloyl-ACP methyl ester carboxylesterase